MVAGESACGETTSVDSGDDTENPYFAYGRQILWIDKDLYRAYYKEVYDRSGEYWKTFLLAGGIALSRDNVFSTPQSDYGSRLTNITLKPTWCYPYVRATIFGSTSG